MERLQNRHHLWYPRVEYRSPSERKLRNHLGFIITADLQSHSELHANMDSPVKPNKAQAYQLLQDIGDFQLGRGGMYVVYYAIEYFNILANSTNEHMSDNAQEIANNLEAQTGYLNFREPESLRRSA